MSEPIKVGDEIIIKDYSYSLLLRNKTLNQYVLNRLSDHSGWVVIVTGCVLPTDKEIDDCYMNDTVIMDDNGNVVFICSSFICKKPEKKLFVKPVKNVMDALISGGYNIDRNGNWYKEGSVPFVSEMFWYCGKEPSEAKNYHFISEWCEYRYV